MAKTMKRPVDKVERQQRLALKIKSHTQRGRLANTRDWAEFYNTDKEMETELDSTEE